MPSDQEAIIAKLKELGALKPCHRCGKSEFSLFEKYSSLNVQDEASGPFQLGGQRIPTVLIICKNCGAITPHAAGVLGLLLDKKEESNDSA